MIQTAIDYLIEQIGNGKIQSTYTKCGYLIESYDDVIEIAKQMEKEQIINAWIATDNELQRTAAEKYYNETYKQ